MTQPAFRVDTSHGRLYITGSEAGRALTMRGAHRNERKNAVELSMTLPRLRELRTTSGLDRVQFARACTSNVLNWTRAAGAIEAHVRTIHERLSAGERQSFPWHDNAATATPPYEHQRVMATVAAWTDGTYFQADPGTGKTRAAMEAAQFQLAHHHLDVVVVVCPRRAAATWMEQVPRWTRGLNLVRLTSGNVMRERAPQIANAKRNDILVLNVDVVMHADILRALDALTKRLRVGLIIDEAHKFKNPAAARTTSLMRIARTCVWRVAMSGTPVLQGVQDVWAQWYLVDFGMTFGANFVSYRRDYLVENEYDRTTAPRPGALEEVGTLMRIRGLRFRKSECMDLPPKVYEVEECNMTDEQTRAYVQMRDNLMVELANGSVADAANQLVAMMRLTQITSGFLRDADAKLNAPFRVNPKLDLLEELVRENLGLSSIIVWARYRFDIDQITARLRDLRPAKLYGGLTDEESDRAVRTFQDGSARVFVANAAAGGTGLNLQVANLALYYSQDYSLEARAQSEDRCHRGGSESHNKVTYIDLLCREASTNLASIDHIVRRAVIEKRNAASLVTDLRQHIALAH